MTNRLAQAVSPYLRSHAQNPVDWQAWGEEPFAEAARRDVPLFVSIGYATCHWCHVMARESFSDPQLARYLNENFVPVKVDREEHPDVDASFLAAASAFTGNLGWPLSVFVTSTGKTFFAGTYFPPEPVRGQPAFRQVLEAVVEAWTQRRDQVESTSSRIQAALAESSAESRAQHGPLPDAAALARVVDEFLAHEDNAHGGFGAAPKFPVAPALSFLLESGSEAGEQLALRTLKRMGASPLRDPVEGGFFRYAVRADWSEPHYERMLYDNALLLRAYARAGVLLAGADARAGAGAGAGAGADSGAGAPNAEWARIVARGVAGFLIDVLQQPDGGFASAQDSESVVDGVRVEGGYYALEAERRAQQTPPALDEKILTGWNGLAIEALAAAGFALDEPQWIVAARRAADRLIARHLRADGTLVRASIGERESAASATLEDYGMLANGLLQLGLVTGEVGYATLARALVDACLLASQQSGTTGFGVPGGVDPVLARLRLALEVDPSEGAYPSGLSAIARASHTLYLLTSLEAYRLAARAGLSLVAAQAVERPVSFGAALELAAALEAEVTQLVVVTPDAVVPDAVVPAAAIPAAMPDAVTSDAVTSDAVVPAAAMPAAVPDAAVPAAGVSGARASGAEPLGAEVPGAATSTVTSADGAAGAAGGSGILAAARTSRAGVVAIVPESWVAEWASAGFELLEGRGTRDDRPTAYFCRAFVCRLPVTDAGALAARR
ncbi:thioredoxin domain-containing protein [Compostimonas suwonensis]|uniref:Spermatogenesis-associated protein 20-like TRX domain-containing protein n=1 Tax=Compostimonas suwonensis TaxID=1048394 RepID=A0A2M9BVY5_9MICO|nr:DUF255 domain-containing protein [Compostimonas suwonensis]PJJ62118.1 hypothetical protein CLV54_1911 [Compostimonas suwonensis]